MAFSSVLRVVGKKKTRPPLGNTSLISQFGEKVISFNCLANALNITSGDNFRSSSVSPSGKTLNTPPSIKTDAFPGVLHREIDLDAQLKKEKTKPPSKILFPENISNTENY